MPRGRKRKSEILGDETANDSSIGPIDEHVGARICARRKLLQLSQKQMAEKLGITFQQIQKYEKGVNRIGAGTPGLPEVQLQPPLLPAFAGTADIPLPALETENLRAHVPAAPRDAVRAPMQAVRLLNFEALLNQCF